MNIPNIVKTLIAKLTPKPSLSNAIADLERQAGRVRQAQERASRDGKLHEENAAAELSKAVAARAESMRAQKIAERLEAITQ